MKLSPLGSGLGAVSTEGAPETPASQNLRRLVMKTDANPREVPQPQQEQAEQPVQETPATEASEVTQPLSPQLAAIAKQKRALQVKERELAMKEKALAESGAKGISLEQLKQAPLKTLLDAGVTYEQLTEDVLANQDAYNPRISALEKQLQSVRDEVQKTLSEKEARAEQQALAEMRREAAALAAEGDEFALVRETRSVGDVVKLIERVYREEGKILGVHEALSLVENEILKETEQRAKIAKVQSRFQPAPAVPQAQSAQRMRTLTNRDNATVTMGRKERAMAAFYGTLKK